MKRVFAAAVVLLMILTLAACDAKLEPLPERWEYFTAEPTPEPIPEPIPEPTPST